MKTPKEVVEEALDERLGADCPDYWPDLGYWAECAIIALNAAGYTILPLEPTADLPG